VQKQTKTDQYSTYWSVIKFLKSNITWRKTHNVQFLVAAVGRRQSMTVS